MSTTQYREVGMLCAVAWGIVDVPGWCRGADAGRFQNIRRQIRLEMRHNRLSLIAYGCDGYRLVARGNTRQRRRNVLCTGNLAACCRRAIDYLGITQGGN
jgi:hypothetical protein